MSETELPKEAIEPAKPKPSGGKRVLRFVGRTLRGSVRFVLLVVVPVVVGIVGIEMYVASGKVVSTENAYVKAEKVAISADIEGRVAELMVKSHALVNKGDVLFILDRRPSEIAVAKATAELGVVANEIRGYQSAYRMEVSEQGMANEDLAYFQREFERQRKLSNSGIVSKAKLDQAQHDMQQVRQRLAGIREQIGNALSRLGGDPEQAVESHPRYLQALAERDAALLHLDQTVVRAPESGTLGNIELQAGEFVQDGQPVFSIVSGSGIWITANLKETQLTHVKPGQEVTITADTYPDRKFPAYVDTIAPATGAEFSLLPPQNASGNWVKVVQRIPVRLSLKDPEDGRLLRAGMSVTAEIITGHERELPEVVRKAMAMIEVGKAQIAQIQTPKA
jgi:membrane fusion protein, multidrug efflux system